MTAQSSFDHLDRHARETPDRIAVTGAEWRISWARFHAEAGRLIQALGWLGVQPGRIVVISQPDPYLHWLSAIACQSLGAVSASLAPDESEGERLLEMADLLLTEARVADLLAQPAGPVEPRPVPAGSDAPLRIIQTSGSTGLPKFLMLTRRMLECRIASIAARNAFDADTRLYLAYSFSANLNYYRAEACLRAGGTVIFGRASQDLVTYDATHCWLLPRDMMALLQGIRGTWPGSRPLRMSLGGGPVSTELHDRTASMLGTEVTVQYGTNETGFIGLQDREGIITPWPKTELKVVDESGRRVPEGQPGRIVARSPCMTAGYLNDPHASAEHFREGWFFTDDIGIPLPGGRLRIAGRRSEILNLGGIKMSPLPFEEKLRAAIPGIREIVVTSILGPQGFEEICLAVVPASSADRSTLMAEIQAEIDPTAGQVWLRLFDALPVGASGKVQRSALREMFAAMRPR